LLVAVPAARSRLRGDHPGRRPGIGHDVDADNAWATAGNVRDVALIPIALSSVFVIPSGQVGVDAEPSALSIIVLPTMIGLAILLWLRRHRTEPERSVAPESNFSEATRERSVRPTA
jgi:hypothetical protein